MSWQTVKLGEVIKHRKGSIVISDTQQYKLCRVQLHRRGVVLRDIVEGVTIKTKKQQVCKAGDFLVAEMDAKLGGYGFVPDELDGAIVSSHYFLFELDLNKIRPMYLEVVSQLKILQHQIKAVGSTNYSAVRPATVLSWEIPLPNLERQKEIEDLFQILTEHTQAITTEQNSQLTYLKHLRQQILSDALQGKLDVPRVVGESGADLLASIHAEKAKTVKKAKPLPEIKADEIPFAIPEHWVWCRLGEICRVKVGATPSRGVPKYWKGDIPWVASGEVANNYISDTKEKITQEGFDSTSLIMYPKGSVLVAMIGQGKTRGQAAILQIDATTNQNVAGLVIEHKYLLSEYLWYFFLSRYEITRSGASGGNQPALNGIKISNTLFPLPPLSEQTEIVNKIETLMAHCDELEASIRQNQAYTQMLYQTALREALQQPAK